MIDLLLRLTPYKDPGSAKDNNLGSWKAQWIACGRMALLKAPAGYRTWIIAYFLRHTIPSNSGYCMLIRKTYLMSAHGISSGTPVIGLRLSNDGLTTYRW